MIFFINVMWWLDFVSHSYMMGLEPKNIVKHMFKILIIVNIRLIYIGQVSIIDKGLTSQVGRDP